MKKNNKEENTNINDTGGLSNFDLKILALIFMIIDHFGYYFKFGISNDMYNACRIIGRLSMPIFLFLLVQGFIHTSNLKKYIFRIFIFAIVTQLVLFLVEFIGINIFNVIHDYNICLTFNILFSFVLCLISLYSFNKSLEYIDIFYKNMLKNERLIEKCKNNVILVLKIIMYIAVEVLIFAIMIFCKFDYGVSTLIISLLLYLLELIIKNDFIKRRSIVNFMLLITIFLVLIKQNNFFITFSSVFSAVFIIFYNEKMFNRKKYNIKYLFYMIFPFQHFILYIFSLFLQR